MLEDFVLAVGMALSYDHGCFFPPLCHAGVLLGILRARIKAELDFWLQFQPEPERCQVAARPEETVLQKGPFGG